MRVPQHLPICLKLIIRIKEPPTDQLHHSSINSDLLVLVSEVDKLEGVEEGEDGGFGESGQGVQGVVEEEKVYQ